MTQERRKRCRVDVTLPLTINCEGQEIQGTTQNLSLKGLACSTEEWIIPGKTCLVTLDLDSGIQIHIQGRIIRAGQDGAIDFLSMDETSFAHLRNVVRLYAEDADVIDSELSNPAFNSMNF